MGVIRQSGGFVFQQRENKPEKGAAGLIGCFGGQINTGETPHAALVREFAEETSLDLTQSYTISELGKINVLSDRNLKVIQLHAIVFDILVPSANKFIAKEGKIVRMSIIDMPDKFDSMTPATKEIVKKFILKGEQ